MEPMELSQSDKETSNLPEAVPKIDHGRIFKAYATPTLPRAIVKSSRNPAQDRLKRLQNALQQGQKSAQEKLKTPPLSIQNRLKITPASTAFPQATKRKAPEDEAKEVPEKKRLVANSPPPISQRPKIKAIGLRLKRPAEKLPSCTAVSAQGSSSSSPVSPPKKAKVPLKVPGKGKYRVSVNCTKDNRLVIDYEESEESESPKPKPLEDAEKDLSKTFYAVVDTNIFCHDLIYLENILNMRFGSTGYAILVIPYIVIQELDNIKHQSGLMRMENNAVKAIKFINEKLQARHPQVKGQTAIAQSDIFLINPFNPDDSILNCCLLIKQKTNNVILLSNDINLRNKALINAINALKPKDLHEGVPIEFL